MEEAQKIFKRIEQLEQQKRYLEAQIHGHQIQQKKSQNSSPFSTSSTNSSSSISPNRTRTLSSPQLLQSYQSLTSNQNQINQNNKNVNSQYVNSQNLNNTQKKQFHMSLPSIPPLEGLSTIPSSSSLPSSPPSSPSSAPSSPPLSPSSSASTSKDRMAEAKKRIHVRRSEKLRNKSEEAKEEKNDGEPGIPAAGVASGSPVLKQEKYTKQHVPDENLDSEVQIYGNLLEKHKQNLVISRNSQNSQTQISESQILHGSVPFDATKQIDEFKKRLEFQVKRV